MEQFKLLKHCDANIFSPHLSCAGVKGHGHLQEGLLSGEEPALLSGPLLHPRHQCDQYPQEGGEHPGGGEREEEGLVGGRPQLPAPPL